MRNIAKLLMNSMFGRFGMHTDLTQTKIVSYSERVKIGEHFTIKSSIQLGSLYLIIYLLGKPPLAAPPEANKLIKKSQPYSLSSRTNVAIASAVTAYSRMIINQHKLTAINAGLNL